MKLRGPLLSVLLLATILLIQSVSPAAAQRRSNYTGDPEASQLITSDIDLFIRALDLIEEGADVRQTLRNEYIRKGSRGLRQYYWQNIRSIDRFAYIFERRRTAYDRIRSVRDALQEQRDDMRTAFRKLKQLYPDAVFPPVYFFVGSYVSAGGISGSGLLISVEMFSANTDMYTPLVSHELIHFQQTSPRPPRGRSRLLLEQAIREGSADYLGELISGRHINGRAHRYGDQHASELWPQFLDDRNLRRWGPWLFGGREVSRRGWPNDLGYYMGYKISEGLIEREGLTSANLRRLLRITDANALLARSGVADTWLEEDGVRRRSGED